MLELYIRSQALHILLRKLLQRQQFISRMEIALGISSLIDGSGLIKTDIWMLTHGLHRSLVDVYLACLCVGEAEPVKDLVGQGA